MIEWFHGLSLFGWITSFVVGSIVGLLSRLVWVRIQSWRRHRRAYPAE